MIIFGIWMLLAGTLGSHQLYFDACQKEEFKPEVCAFDRKLDEMGKAQKARHEARLKAQRGEE